MSGTGRERLMEVAEALFAERGYAATSVRDIVFAAEVTQPSLYHHFGSKEKLLVELMEDRYRRFGQGLDDALGAAGGAREVLEAYVTYILDRMRNAPTTARFVFGTMFGPQHGLPVEALHPLLARQRGILPAHLRRCAPKVDRRRVSFVAMVIQGLVTPIVLHFLSFGPSSGDVPLPSQAPRALARRAEAMLHDRGPIFEWIA